MAAGHLRNPVFLMPLSSQRKIFEDKKGYSCHIDEEKELLFAVGGIWPES